MAKVRSFCLHFGLAACAACCCLACRDGNKASDAGGVAAIEAPCLWDMGIKQPVAGWSREGGDTISFVYRGGRMVGGRSAKYGTFTLGSHPLEMRVTRRKGDGGSVQAGKVRFDSIRVTPEGYVSNMAFSSSGYGKTYGRETPSFRGKVSAAYNSGGYITGMDYYWESGRKEKETGVARYVWKDGDLQTMVVDRFRTHVPYERHETFSFSYGAPDSLLPNPGIYPEEMNRFPFLFDFMWYAGLWGRTTRHIPVSVAYGCVGDGLNHSGTYSFRINLQPERHTAVLSYSGNVPLPIL